MYDVVEAVINSGRFELSDILKKIDTIWLQGGFSNEDRDSLVEIAREKANPENSYADVRIQISEVFDEISSIKGIIGQINSQIEDLSSAVFGEDIPGPGDQDVHDISDEDTWPEYSQPTGAHNAYYNGDKITFNEKKYVCIAPDGAPCVWSPEDYPAYWQEKT